MIHLLAAVLSVGIGISLGLLGGGGSILTVPLLVHVLDVEPKEAIAASLVVVGVTSATGLVPHARAGNVHWRTGAAFGAAGMVGAFFGGWLAAFLSGRVLLILFSLVMLATGLAMLRPRAARESGRAPTYAAWRVVTDGVAVGAVTGLVGAGGGFVVVPALVLVGGLPMRTAIGTSLLVIALKSFAGWFGHASHVSMDWALTSAVTAAAVVGSILGGRLALRVRPDALRRGFGLFVLAMAVAQLVAAL